MSLPFSRSLPANPDLAQQKKQAKELLQSFSAGDAEAQARVRAVLPDKKKIALADAQFVVAREYGFTDWASLKRHIGASAKPAIAPEVQMRDALQRGDADGLRRLFETHAGLRGQIDAPIFSFDAPALVAYSNNAAIVDVLLDFGADPNRRSDWWAGGFHALYGATPASAERLIGAGAIPDACAAAHLDRLDLLTAIIARDPTRVNERRGDGQTPLHFATSRAVVDLLLAAGADIDARDVDHRSTAAEWMLASKRGAGRYELARYLVERGASADIFLAAALGLRDRARAMLEARPELVDLRTSRGDYAEKPPSSYHIYMWTIGDSCSPLDVAAQFDQPETLGAMAEFASPVQRLHLACRVGDESRARVLLREHPGLIQAMGPDDHRAITDAAWRGDAAAVALMLDLGFDPRTPGPDTGSALHCAAWQGSPETVAVLLRHRDGRALVNVRDAHHGGTPLGWCSHGSRFGSTSHDHAGVARLLLEAGARPGPEPTDASESVTAVLADWRRA